MAEDQPSDPVQDAGKSKPPAFVDILVSEARSRIDGQLSNNDSHDVKATAVLAGAGVIIALVVAASTDWGRVWWVPISLSILAALPAGLALWPRDYHPGPNLTEFYNRHWREDAAEAAWQMYSELQACQVHNGKKLAIKVLEARIGLLLLFLTSPISAVCWWKWR